MSRSVSDVGKNLFSLGKAPWMRLGGIVFDACQDNVERDEHEDVECLTDCRCVAQKVGKWLNVVVAEE